MDREELGWEKDLRSEVFVFPLEQSLPGTFLTLSRGVTEGLILLLNPWG